MAWQPKVILFVAISSLTVFGSSQLAAAEPMALDCVLNALGIGDALDASARSNADAPIAGSQDTGDWVTPAMIKRVESRMAELKKLSKPTGSESTDPALKAFQIALKPVIKAIHESFKSGWLSKAYQVANDALGFASQDRVSSQPIQAPSSAGFARAYASLQDEWNVPTDSRVRPVHVYQDKSGKLKLLEPGKKPQPGWVKREVDAKDILACLKAGAYPLDVISEAGSGYNFLYHDTRHLIGLLLYPKIAKALKARAHDVDPGNYSSAIAFHLVTEGLVVPRVSADEILKAFELPEVVWAKGKLFHKELSPYFDALGDQELDRLIARVQAKLPLLVEHLGGDTAEWAAYSRADPKRESEGRFRSLYGHAYFLSLIQDVLDLGPAVSEFHEGLPEFRQFGRVPRWIKQKMLVKAASYLLLMRKYGPEEVVRSALGRKKPRKDGAFYKIFCEGEIALESNYWDLLCL